MSWVEKISRDQKAKLEKRSRARNWKAQHKARVTHPKYGSVVVPCASPLAAQECAAEVWKTTWSEIHKEAKVEAV